ncbi:MAG: hypothetical protein A2233_04830 [Candidatus Kerfeldbacteria bacterium RIFOXYA2_FULL_38_24]|uniref:Cytidyltransferase-like domain-containing protein n=1 Tax=Candidatus Kerfeldbacteria bacterium RIFOXYB2_FULL_38_14 TaxID=1798547 RepID=A0A1G2BFW7_9BACT|nr:MAG: hypothetical protein A2319_02250 [Candidatus Kerfeldbacteria bacterium RIFOXYB2_FULL_38_14]OGY88195.1 MAG: hypothetical protein A2233_04830 [Candidatus Kerfeldbacteria bacterium RIFOXYA2_FULL_38_24]OGY89215.1 MAG: hypothetical protein A2458_01305 [Candidatus Kerfeldbacteria bacterium RIFOXYC2_FULL_38_9]
MKKTVLVFGTFDLFHPGHRFFLQEAKKHGDFLVVVVARDQNVKKIKGKKPNEDEKTRRSLVANFSAVDKAILGYQDWKKHEQVLQDIKPNVVCLGYDQQAKIAPGTWEIVRLPSFHPEKYKTSLLVKKTPREATKKNFHK